MGTRTAFAHKLRDPLSPRTVSVVYKNVHGSKPNKLEYSGANRILAHRLCGCIQLSDLRRRTGATLFVYKLGSTLTTRTVGVQFR